jgi:hypothetical protein
VHVLPAGGSPRDDSLLSYRDARLVADRIRRAHEVSAGYLREHL